MAADHLLRIGSRGSELALWQARWVQRSLEQRFPDLRIEIRIVKTKGDRILDSPLSRIGDKGLFTREIENGLLHGEIDLAVHSLKDLPTELPEGLSIGAICEREDPRDVFIPHPSNGVKTLRQQEKGAKVATGSLRRMCQVLHVRPDVEVIDLRGNLNTRMDKLERSDWAGMILARAGVARLGWASRIGETLDVTDMLPAVGQGALAVEVRQGDAEVASYVSSLHHEETARSVTAERSLLHCLEGGCQIPIGAYGRTDGEKGLCLDAVVGSLDGRKIVRGGIAGPADDAGALGRDLGRRLLADGADEILRAIRSAETSRVIDA